MQSATNTTKVPAHGEVYLIQLYLLNFVIVFFPGTMVPPSVKLTKLNNVLMGGLTIFQLYNQSVPKHLAKLDQTVF